MANLIRFDPFREMISMRQVMDRLFDGTVASARARIKAAESEPAAVASESGNGSEPA